MTILPQDDGLLSRIQWVDDNPYIYLRSDIPTHAIPHILGTALCHVKQKIDQFPDVVHNDDEDEPEGVVLARMTLKEIILSLQSFFETVLELACGRLRSIASNCDAILDEISLIDLSIQKISISFLTFNSSRGASPKQGLFSLLSKSPEIPTLNILDSP